MLFEIILTVARKLHSKVVLQLCDNVPVDIIPGNF